MNTKPSRFGMRFSLRALIIVVTLVACWLGWEMSVIRERRRLRDEAAKEGVFQFQMAAAVAPVPGAPPPQVARVSFVRRILGDEAVQTVWHWSIGQAVSTTKRAELQRAFPEAQFKEYLPEPCHPGCFPAGTMVETPTGPRAIETIASGEEVSIVLPNGKSGAAKVQTVFVTENILWRVETANETLVTTETQPLCLADGTPREAGKLNAGEVIRRWQDGAVREVAVVQVTSLYRRAKVFNLILGDKEMFIANGFVARSKPPVSAAVTAQVAD